MYSQHNLSPKLRQSIRLTSLQDLLNYDTRGLGSPKPWLNADMINVAAAGTQPEWTAAAGGLNVQYVIVKMPFQTALHLESKLIFHFVA